MIYIHTLHVLYISCIGRYRLDDGEKAYSTGDVLEYSPAILTQVRFRHIYDIYVYCTMLMLLKLGRPLYDRETMST